MTPNDQITELLKFTISLLGKQRETEINERDEARAKLEIAVGVLTEFAESGNYGWQDAMEVLKKIRGET